jgi:hypothetical protein
VRSFFGEAIEFMVDVKKTLHEAVKFTLGFRFQLRLEQLEKVTGGGKGLANGNEVDSLRSGGDRWKRELGNGMEYERVLTGAVKFTL